MSKAIQLIVLSARWELKELDVSKLVIDPAYQRELNEIRAQKIARNFDIRLVGALSVSFRDGHFYVLRGQHRMQGARRAGVQTLPCIVYYDLTQADEKSIWLKEADTTAKISPAERHHSDLLDDPTAQGVESVLRKHGFPGFSRGGVRPVSTAYWCYRHNTLDRVLSAIRKSWRTPDGEAFLVGALTGRSLRALGEFLARHPDASDARLQTVMGRHNPSEFKYRHQEGQGAWEIVRDWYNAGLSVGRLGEALSLEPEQLIATGDAR